MSDLRVPLYSAETSAPTFVVAVTGDEKSAFDCEVVHEHGHHETQAALLRQEPLGLWQGLLWHVFWQQVRKFVQVLAAYLPHCDEIYVLPAYRLTAGG